MDNLVKTREHTDGCIEEEGNIREISFLKEHPEAFPEGSDHKNYEENKSYKAAMKPCGKIQIVRVFYDNPIGERMGESFEYSVSEEHLLFDERHGGLEDLDPVRISPRNDHVIEKSVSCGEVNRSQKGDAAEHKKQFAVACE